MGRKSEGRGWKITCIIDKTPFLQPKINLGTLKTSGARFLEVP
jgi:hypothetical protein